MTPSLTPPLRLYGRPGCHLCDETRASLATILLERQAAGLAVPSIEERDITTDPRWERAYLETIPVLEVAGRELTLATSPSAIRRLLADTLDVDPAGHTIPNAMLGPDTGGGRSSEVRPR